MQIQLAFVAVVAMFVAPATVAQPSLSDYLPPGTTYDESVPLPHSVLGFEVGEWHVRHDQLVSYFAVLAKRSERLRIHVTGYTHERRPLLMATISSPENLARIEKIRQQHLRLSDPTADVDTGQHITRYFMLAFAIINTQLNLFGMG